MVPTSGLEKLVRQDQLDDQDWFELIEERLALIKPHLSTFSLSELGELECLRSEGSFTHALRYDDPTLDGDRKFSLKTRGIFRSQHFSDVGHFPNSGYQPGRTSGYIACPDGIMMVWGLTDSGLWVIVEIAFSGEPGYKDRGYERATSVTIKEAGLQAIISQTKDKPQTIWNELGEAIQVWTESRKSLYHQALEINRAVQLEELTLSLIPSNGLNQ